MSNNDEKYPSVTREKMTALNDYVASVTADNPSARADDVRAYWIENTNDPQLDAWFAAQNPNVAADRVSDGHVSASRYNLNSVSPTLTERQTRSLEATVRKFTGVLSSDEATEHWVKLQQDDRINSWFATQSPPLATPFVPVAPRPSLNGQVPILSDSQRADLGAHLDAVLAGRTGSPGEILVETESWAMTQDDPGINQWLWHQQTEANGLTRSTGTTTGFALRDHLNSLGARHLSFHQAAHFGVELVHHPDSDHNQVFHTADGDIVYLTEDADAWDIVENGRKGVPVISGEMGRKHLAYTSKDARIHHTAIVADTATVEPGARIGPHATVGEHAHVGVDTSISSYARVEDGAFVGAFSSVRDGSRVGPGAVVGTGSNVGSTANVGSGARLEQNTRVDAFDNVAASSHIGGSTKGRSTDRGLRPGQVSNLVDRLAQLDRD